MIQNNPTDKSETTENRQAGMEGLAAAVIELAVKDLKEANSHTQSAAYFFKNCPKLLEFWLSTATHGGRRKIDLDAAKKRLYTMAIEAENLRDQKITLLKKQKELRKLSKRAEEGKLSRKEERTLKSLKDWMTSQTLDNPTPTVVKSAQPTIPHHTDLQHTR